MAAIFHYKIEYILDMNINHFDNLINEWVELQNEMATGKSTPTLKQYEIDALAKVKERYNANRRNGSTDKGT